LLFGNESAAQDSWISLHGSFGASTDYFSQGNSALPQLDPVHRASISMSLNLFNQVELPFSAYITNRGGAGYSQPFNQFGISPKVGNWLQLHGGYFSKNYSEFTLGDVRLIGGGADVTLERFQVSALYGYSLLSRNPDSTQNFAGTYSRRIMGGRASFTSGKSILALTLIHAQDDQNSITPILSTPKPYENFVSSLSYTGNIIENVLDINAEGGISLFNANTKSMLADSNNRITELESLVGFNSSSSIDAAFRIGAGLNISESFSIRGNMRWIGPGFISLGYAQMFNDVMDITISPSIRLFENMLTMNGSIGTRTNNLRGMKEATTSQVIGSLSVNVQLTQQIAIDASYSNFGIRSTAVNDTIRTSNISQFFSLSPRINFQMFEATNTASVSAQYQSSNDNTQFSQRLINNQNTTISVMHSIAFQSSLSFTTVAMQNSGQSGGASAIKTSVTNINETVGYSILDKALMLNASLGMNFIKAGADNSQFFVRCMVSYSAGAWGNLSLSVLNNSYDYSATGALSYSELQGSLQYGVSF
jgi:hypothetical protein